MNKYRTYIRSGLLVSLILISVYIGVFKKGIVDEVAAELVTFVSIVSGAILASLNGLLRKLNVDSSEVTSAKIRNVNKFWIAFLYIALICAIITIVGKALKWPEISILNYLDIDILGAIIVFLFGCIILLMFLDFTKMISYMTSVQLEAEKNTKVEEFVVPQVSDDKYRVITGKK